MRMRFDPVPVGDGFLDLFACTVNGHGGDYNLSGLCEGVVQDTDGGLKLHFSDTELSIFLPPFYKVCVCGEAHISPLP